VGSIVTDVLTLGVMGVGGLLGIAGWWAFIEAIQTSEDAYRAVGTSKTPWLLAILFTGGIAGVVWWFKVRRQVLSLVRNPPPPAAGFHPVPGTNTWRWWDGSQWVGPPQSPPPPAEPDDAS
jgi:hypothetical protein